MSGSSRLARAVRGQEPRSSLRRLGAGIAAAVLAASGLALVLAPPSAATLGPSPSQFESGDGNMILNTDGNTDWNCFNSSAVLSTTTGLSCNSAVTGVTFGPPTGSSPAVNFPAPNAYTGNDPSWVPGQKMDQGTCIPGTDSKSPAKDTFTDVASYNETAVSGGALGDTYLYGATERVAANGSASENIELSKTAGQNAPSGACTNSPVIYRTAGDKLIALNYISGGSTLAPPQILTWVTSSSGLTDSTGTYAGSCVVSSDQVPCWSSTVETMPAGTFEGRTNPAPIPAGQNGIGGDALAIAQFAEFGINLSTVGVIPTGSCSAFAQETWEARSSGSSFTSNPSDIEVETHQVSNCGNVTVIKHTDPRTSSQQFSYTSSGLLDNSKAGGTCSGIASANFCLTDDGTASGHAVDGTDNTVADNGVPPGSVSISEGAVTNWEVESLVCTKTGSATPLVNKTSASTDPGIASFTLGPKDTVQCIYTNKLQPGAIQITKVSTKSNTAVLSGATFTIKDSQGHAATGTWANSSGGTTGSSGVVCMDGLAPGTYTVTETSAPSHYGNGDSLGQQVTVSSSGTCASGATTVTIGDPPLTDILVKVTSEAPSPGGSLSNVSCVDTSSGTSGTWSQNPAGATLGDPASAGRNGYLPTGTGTITVTCTVKIDP